MRNREGPRPNRFCMHCASRLSSRTIPSECPAAAQNHQMRCGAISNRSADLTTKTNAAVLTQCPHAYLSAPGSLESCSRLKRSGQAEHLNAHHSVAESLCCGLFGKYVGKPYVEPLCSKSDPDLPHTKEFSKDPKKRRQTTHAASGFSDLAEGVWESIRRSIPWAESASQAD